MPFPADRYVANYVAAPAPPLDAADLARARGYVWSVPFRNAVYGKLFNPAALAAYWKTEQGQELLRAQAAAQPAAPKPALSAADSKRAVFGFVLGAPLEALPECGLLQLERSSTTCLRPALWGVHVGNFQRVTGRDKPPAGMQWVAVLLADSACPSWVADCTLVFSVKARTALAVEFATHGDAAAIEEKLSPRFGTPKNDGWSSCMNSPHKGTNKRWASNGLEVVFHPYGRGECTRGYVAVKSERFQETVKQVNASEPQI
jgi:hypothetical protein